MKISLNWVFDHIKGESSRIDVAQLVDTFIKTTAEIEGWKKVTLATDNLTFVSVVSVSDEAIVVNSPEYNKEYILPARVGVAVGAWYLIEHVGNNAVWATSVHLGGTKEMLLPALVMSEDMRAGSWKQIAELHDYILDVDNKSINNRPDLWSHRGLAREIAAMFDLPLRPLDEFVVEVPVATQADMSNPFVLSIQAHQVCKRFTSLYIPSIAPQASHFSVALRLSRLDSRSIDFLVDATNYVMLDLGQPMHAFDADALTNKNVSIAYARDKEKLALLDGETIELAAQDIVVTDGEQAVSLAGVMGGATTAITANTQSVLLESANFDATTVRRTAARHKKRTESSMRFEKSLDPHNAINALKRYLFLLNQSGIAYTVSESIVALGDLEPSKVIIIKHAFIESMLGVIVKSERVVSILKKLDFVVSQSVENSAIQYDIIVPTFRATKDIKIPEDIVEEIGRSVGYDTLPRVMPALPLRPNDLHKTYTTRAIKQLLSYGFMMRELYGYSFFDESMLRQLSWKPSNFVAIKNPISENYTRMVTTLQPNLLKAFSENSIHHTQLRFYEWARVWDMQGEKISERKSLSGIFFDHPSNFAKASLDTSTCGGIDFYSGKEYLNRLFQELYMDVTWQKSENIEYPWYSPHQIAVLILGDKRIGTAGMVDDSVVALLSPAGGSAFIFELDGDALLEYKRPLVRFNALSKYPTVRRDVSILIGADITTATLIHSIKSVDSRIDDVTLLDFFTKPEWKDQKAMTFHVEMNDKEKTLVSDEVEEIWQRVITQLQQQGAVIR